MADAHSIQHTQRTIALGTPSLRIEWMVRRATQGSIWLRGKCRAGKAVGKRGTCPLWWAIYDRRYGCLRGFRLVGRGNFGLACRRKFSRAQLGWRELLPQFSSKVPNPLREDLGELLATRGVGVPAIHVLLMVFIGQCGFKRATMQVQVQYVRGRKRRRGKGC